MKHRELRAEVALGEDSTRQLKRDVTNGDGLAAEMAAFANAEGDEQRSRQDKTKKR